MSGDILASKGAQIVSKPSFSPARVDAGEYIQNVRERVQEYMRPYEGMTYDALMELDQKDVRRCRADVNRLINSVNEQRLAIKRAYMAPLDEFEHQIADALTEAKAAEQMLKTVIDKNTGLAKAKRLDTLRGAYEEFAPALVPVVPIGVLVKQHPSWLNASFSEAKALEELTDAVAKIARDWEALKAMRDALPYYSQAEAEFFRSLDMAKAVEHARSIAEEQERIKELHATVEHTDELERKTYVLTIDLYEGEMVALVEFIKNNDIGANRYMGVKYE